jgi:hypothetical protein
MNRRMTIWTEGNQILLGILASVASKLLMVDFQMRHRAARLTPPAVATQHPLP